MIIFLRPFDRYHPFFCICSEYRFHVNVFPVLFDLITVFLLCTAISKALFVITSESFINLKMGIIFNR